MDAEIINVGTELLTGATLNTHQRYLAAECARLGLDLYHISTVGDNPARLAEKIITALTRSDILLVTGGLGPTTDDITMKTAAAACGLVLQTHTPTLEAIRKRINARHMSMTLEQKRQALIPHGAVVMHNAFGTAPGVYIRARRGGTTRHIFLFPGPPRELIPMFNKYAVPLVRGLLGKKRVHFARHDLCFPGSAEMEIAPRVKELLEKGPPVTLGIYASPGITQLSIIARHSSLVTARRLARRMKQQVLKRCRGLLVLEKPESLSSRLGRMLKKQKKTLAVTESCTGGLLGFEIIRTPGASNYFLGGIIAYDKTAKAIHLGVSLSSLRRHGAVSRVVARQMAKGALRRFQSDVALSVTGVAGPSGGSREKPVGRVYFGLATRKKTLTFRRQFTGSREEIQSKSAAEALILLVKFLSGMRL